MLKSNNHAAFDALPKESLLEILLQLSVKDVSRYCEHSQYAYNICDENFWHYYRTTKWPYDYLRNIMNDKSKFISNEKIDELLAYRVFEPTRIGLTYKEQEISLFLENSKIINIQRAKFGYFVPYDKKKYLVSEYDTIGFYLHFRPDWLYMSSLQGDNLTVLTEEARNVIHVRAYGSRNMIPSVNGYPNKILDEKNIEVEVGDNIDKIYIKDVYINEFPLIQYITDFIMIIPTDFR
jgi:hypothetical protein